MRLRLAGLALLVALGADAQAAPQAEPGDARGSRVRLDDVDPQVGNERVVDLYFRVLGSRDEPVPVTLRDLHVTEDDREVELIKLERLQETERGFATVLAIDTSRTMRARFAKVRAAALAFLARLGARDRVAIVQFADRAELVAGFDEPKVVRPALEALGIADASLHTALFDALHDSLTLISDHRSELPRRAIVVVFSDGGDSGSTYTLEQVTALAQGDATQPRVLGYAIGYAGFGDEGLGVLRRFAADSWGSYREARSLDELQGFYEEIAASLQRSYVASFATDLDGLPHAIRLDAADASPDQRSAKYPLVARPIWPYAVGVGALVLLVVGAVVLRALRNVGRLVYLEGPRRGAVLRLRRGVLRIGARPDNDLVIPSPAVSGYHAELQVQRGRVEIRDLHSTNGTEVNGKPIQSILLHPGDTVRLADVSLRLER